MFSKSPLPLSRGARHLLLRGCLDAQALLLFSEFGRERGTKVVRLEHLANFDLAIRVMGIRATLDPFDGLFPRLDLPEPKAREHFLRLGERPVNHGSICS